MSTVLTELDEINLYLRNPTGMAVISLIDCKPCEYFWKQYLNTSSNLKITKIVFDPKSKEHRGAIRDLSIKAFPTFIRFDEGIEASRLNGLIMSKNGENIVDFIAKKLAPDSLKST